MQLPAHPFTSVKVPAWTGTGIIDTMPTSKPFRRLFRITRFRSDPERDIRDEIEFYLEMRAREFMAEGMEPELAQRRAREVFGNLARVKSTCREITEPAVRREKRRLAMDNLGSDLKFGLRILRKSPLASLLAVLTLALGIGASTAMLSVVNGVLLDPLPYPNSERLVWVGNTLDGEPQGTSALEFLALKRESRTLEKYAAYFRENYGILLDDRPEEFMVVGVTRDYFDVFGANPFLGRAFTDDDFRPGAPPVALLSHNTWQRHWGGDPDVLGATIENTEEHSPAVPFAAATIIGVMPSSVDERTDLWVPMHLDTGWWSQEWQFENWILASVGKLASGSSLSAFQSEADKLVARLATEHPRYFSGESNDGRSIRAVSLLDRTVGSHRAGILLLSAGAFLLLAIAILNLTGLFLARALDRKQELAVRTAIGGGRFHIFRHLATETTALSLLGGVVGFLLAVGCLAILRTLAPADLPRLDNIGPDLGVVLFTTIVALVSGLISALASFPSRRGGGLDAFLRESDRTGANRGTEKLRGLLVAAQVSLVVILLVGAALLSTSLAKLRQIDPGFEAENLSVMSIRFPVSYETNQSKGVLLSDIVNRLTAVPGVVSASWTPDPPMYWRYWVMRIGTQETLDLPEEQLPRIGTHPVGPDYFSTMGIPILQGRGITRIDNDQNRPVVVVDEGAAERLWPSQDPIGRELILRDERWTVVGVAGRVHQTELSGEAEPEIYISAFQAPFYFPTTSVVIRSEIPVAEAAETFRAAAWEQDGMVIVSSISSAEDQVTDNLQTPRFFVFLGSAFSLTSLILTLAAIFGLMSCWVNARTREVSLRMALGARSGQVLWTVIRRSLVMVIAGVGAGLVLAAGASRLLSALLFEVSPVDIPTYALVGIGLCLLAPLASLAPALRATRVEPTIALKGE